jgi:hypothetical protein
MARFPFRPAGAFLWCRPLVLAAFFTLCFGGESARAGEQVIDLASLKVTVPADRGARAEVVTEEPDKIPVLRLQFPDEAMEAWRSKLRAEIPSAVPGENVLSFLARAEPGDCTISVRVADPSGREVLASKFFTLDGDWKEYVVEFTVKDGEPASLGLQWGNLARPGRTISIRDIKVTQP